MKKNDGKNSKSKTKIGEIYSYNSNYISYCTHSNNSIDRQIFFNYNTKRKNC